MSEPSEPLKPAPPAPSAPQPATVSVVSVNRRPLYAVGIAVLFVLFVLLAYLNPKPGAREEAPKPPPATDPTSLLGRFLAEQESRARRQAEAPVPAAPRPAPVPPPSMPTMPSIPAPQVAAAGDPNDAPVPGTYDPRWPSFLARQGSNASETPRQDRVPDRPVIRFRAGEKAAQTSADPVTDALAKLLPKASEEAAARPGEAGIPETGEVSRKALSVPLALRPAALGTPYQLLAGALIPATLETAIRSDLPGLATALVRRDTYDSATGRYLLIPQGARLLGQYNSDVRHGDARLLLAWTRLLLPDGTSFDLSQASAADLVGASGLAAHVDNHWARLYGSALLLSVVSAGAQLSQAPASSDLRRGPTTSEVAAGALGQQLGEVSSGLLRREIDLRPSLSLPAGTPFNVQVAADLEFPAPYRAARR